MKRTLKTGEKIWVGTFITLWVLVSTVSTFHSLDFFGLSNDTFLSWLLAIGFEIGAMASLGGMLVSRGNKTIVWLLFILLTAFQIHGNMYYAWAHAGDISEWTKLFDLVDEDPNMTKRIFAFISGGILPLVSLGFIKSLMDYMRPKDDAPDESETEVKEEVSDKTDELIEVIKENQDDIEEVEDGFELTDDELDEQREKVNTMEKVEPSNVDIKIESRKVEGGDTIKTDTKLVYPEPGELYELAKQDAPSPENAISIDDAIDITPSIMKQDESVELNKKRPSTKLGDIIDDAENTVNSIGEK